MDKLRLTKVINNHKLSCAVFITILILIQLSEANPERKKTVSLNVFYIIKINTKRHNIIIDSDFSVKMNF